MAHLRSQIRDAAHTALEAGLSATVKKTRVYSLNSATSIAYSVYTNGVERITQRTSSYMMRELPVIVEIVAADDTDTLDDTLDDKCVLVEQTLSNNKLSGLCKDMRLDTTEIETDGTGETPKGVARLTFLALYATTEADPETAT